MGKIDWSYHRPGCTTCGKTQTYLTGQEIEVREEVNAKKNTLGVADALRLASEATEIYAAKGKKVVHYNMKKDKPSEEDLKKIMLGPTGNLRAPTLRVGKKLIIGFEQGMYDELLK